MQNVGHSVPVGDVAEGRIPCQVAAGSRVCETTGVAAKMSALREERASDPIPLESYSAITKVWP